VEAGDLAAEVRAASGDMETKQFLQALDDGIIAHAIAAAEKRTSGEIRVFVTERSIQDPVVEGRKQFVQLGMNKTRERNGVLIYFAPQSQLFSVIGDDGIHLRCGQAFWEEVAGKMTPLLKLGQYTQAVVAGIEQVGTVLAREFPFQEGDRNELQNQVVREKRSDE
jgi:uncharacterized membrane protein